MIFLGLIFVFFTNSLLYASQTLCNLYLQAVAKSEITNPKFLTQEKYGYANDPEFLIPMGKGIDEVSKKLKADITKAASKPITAELVKQRLDILARVRHEIAAKQKGPKNKFGEDCSKCANDLLMKGKGRHQDFFDKGIQYLRQMASYQGKKLEDIQPHASSQGSWEARIIEGIARKHAVSLLHDEVKIGNKRISLSTFDLKGNSETNEVDAIHVHHPEGEDLKLIRQKAYEILSEVLNDKSLTESQSLDKMANAYFLLMHGTPYVFGSPSIVESFFDSIFRSKFGKTLKAKKIDEPFWKVIFWDSRANGAFKGKDFLECFEVVSK